MSHTAHTHQIGPENALCLEVPFAPGTFRAYCRALGNVPCAFRLLRTRWWPFSYSIGLLETDDPTPMFIILRPALAAGEVCQQALIAWVEGGMVASPN